MNNLLAKFNDFKRLNNFCFCYKLQNGITIKLRISQFNFPHLIGLQKLTDISIISSFNDPSNKICSASYILSKIKKEYLLTDLSIKNSIHYNEISDRYELFNYNLLISLLNTNLIYEFNNVITHSKIQSKYLFVYRFGALNYYLGIVPTMNNEYKIETFFVRQDNRYERNQKQINVNKISVLDGNNKSIDFSKLI